jgi:hypothetical protein
VSSFAGRRLIERDSVLDCAALRRFQHHETTKAPEGGAVQNLSVHERPGSGLRIRFWRSCGRDEAEIVEESVPSASLRRRLPTMLKVL